MKIVAIILGVIGLGFIVLLVVADASANHSNAMGPLALLCCIVAVVVMILLAVTLGGRNNPRRMAAARAYSAPQNQTAAQPQTATQPQAAAQRQTADEPQVSPGPETPQVQHAQSVTPDSGDEGNEAPAEGPGE